MLRRGLALLLALGVALSAASAGVPDWKEHEAAFWKSWLGDKKTPRNLLPKYRARKRRASNALRNVADVRAIQVLAKALKRQRGLVAVLHDEWADRRAKWQKLEKAMRRSLEAKAKLHGTPNFPVSPGERAWMNEEIRLEGLFREVTAEREIASHARTSMARVVASLEGRDRAAGIKAVLAHVGKGDTPDARDFVRVLGEIEGDDVSAALTKLAQRPLAPLVQVALESLGRQHAPGNVARLRAFLEDPRWQVRAAAIGALGYFRQADVVDLLIERAAAEPGGVQRHCFIALHRILGEAIPGGVDAWKVWWGKHRERVVADWSGEAPRPIKKRSEPVMVRQGQGHTTFYGIQTNSKHIVFIIDRSGSMQQADEGGAAKGKPRIDTAREELKKAIRSLSAVDGDERGAASFNIVAYAGSVTVFKTGKMVAATQRNKEEAFAWIDGLEAVGATNIYDAIEMAFQIISETRPSKNAEKGGDTFFLMTDGAPTTGKVRSPDLIRSEVAKLNATRQVVIHTIGVGEQHRARFLKRLAAENHGEYIAR